MLDDKIYVVIGVTEFRDATGSIGGSFSGQDYNRDVYIPLETLEARIGTMVLTAKAGTARRGDRRPEPDHGDGAPMETVDETSS